jgi:hypothetical protein
MLKKQKTKNYAELENARVFHNLKTDLIEITGKYVDGGNFSVVLPKGTKSDIKVRTEISTKDSPLHPEDSDVENPQAVLPWKASVVYDQNPRDFDQKIVRDGNLWHSADNKHEVFYFPEFSPELNSKYPLGVGINRNPVFVDLEAPSKNNVFISAHPGRGGVMSFANLVFHVLYHMSETKIISNTAEKYFTLKPRNEEQASRLHVLKDLFLLDHLRGLHTTMLQAPYGAKERKEVILIDDFEQFIDGDIPSGPSARTTKAVRAELMDLILEISKINRPEFKICFVFMSDYMNENMNAFLDTAGTIIAFASPRYKPTERNQYAKYFGRDLHQLAQQKPGCGYITSPLVNKDGEFFDTFLNEEVIGSFQAHPYNFRDRSYSTKAPAPAV